MNDHGDLVSALLAVFAVVAGVIVLLMALTAILWRRHRRRRADGTARRDTLTMGDLVAEELLAKRFRSDARDRRDTVWYEQAEADQRRDVVRRAATGEPPEPRPDGESAGGDAAGDHGF